MEIDKELFVSYWQVAVDGIWEDARGLPVAPQLEDLKEFLEWVSKAGEDVAIEAFFGDKNTGNFGFFGVRIASLTKERQVLFIHELIDSVVPSDNSDTFALKFKNTLEKFVPEMPQLNIFEQSPYFLELGVEGFWKSYGSYVVWKKGDIYPKTINDIEKHAAQLLRPYERAVMMEYAYQRPIPMWIAVPVSTKTSDGFIFDRQKYSSLIDTTIFNPTRVKNAT